MFTSDQNTAVGKIPSGLFIVCAKKEEQIDGFLGSWIQQISFEPLLISLCIKPGRPAYDLITAGTNFTVNIVGDHKKDLLKHFWSGYDPTKNPFASLSYEVSPLDGILLEDSFAIIEAKMQQSIKPGDHELVIAEVLKSHFNPELASAKPMFHLRKDGISY